MSIKERRKWSDAVEGGQSQDQRKGRAGRWQGAEAALLGGRTEGGAWEPCFSPLRLPPPLPKACISYPYNDSGSGGVWAAYGSRTSSSTVLYIKQFHPQIAGGGTSARIPLPLELAENEPIYVNPKQYHGILRRRQFRAKLEAQNKLVKARKPYLHESRHLHAMKRARGSGGRFLNTKQLQQQPRNASTRSTTNGTASSSGSTHLRLGGGTARDQTMLAPKAMPSQYNSKKAVSSAPGFTVTPMLHRDDTFFQHPSHHLSFSGHFGQASAQAGMHNGTQQRVPVMR
ncbi:nuclear transcription factor Y subunit A-3-like isoform X3 [Panicum virgatum]|uniref:nuclear transcription factor Y subunit A-3-like isoform X3 n=1 Tax=Panicum virgatum TaxID=38727 RepID=UPI0019D5B3FA|nr:nuclear transcription factor Y subunit A-3-like isoform X3 [Panicum virgatum]